MPHHLPWKAEDGGFITGRSGKGLFRTCMFQIHTAQNTVYTTIASPKASTAHSQPHNMALNRATPTTFFCIHVTGKRAGAASAVGVQTEESSGVRSVLGVHAVRRTTLAEKHQSASGPALLSAAPTTVGKRHRQYRVPPLTKAASVLLLIYIFFAKG